MFDLQTPINGFKINHFIATKIDFLFKFNSLFAHVTLKAKLKLLRRKNDKNMVAIMLS